MTAIAAFTLTSPVTQQAAPFHIGHAFKKGDVPSGMSLWLDTPNFAIVPLKLWNDGSVKHAAIMGRAALTANTPLQVNISARSTAPIAGTALTATNIQAAAPSASVQLGSIGTVQLSSLLSTPKRTFISTPEMVECHYVSPVGTDASLFVTFHVRLYADSRMWVRASVTNGYLNGTEKVLKTYVPTVIIGGNTIFTNNGGAYYHSFGARWDQTGWIGTDPQITPRHDTGYLNRTKLVPNYWKTGASNTAISAYSGLTYTPGANLTISTAMGATGAQPQIGVLPKWDALYFSSQADPTMYAAVLSHTRAIYSYGISFFDATTYDPIRISDFKTWSVSGANQGGVNQLSTLQQDGKSSLVWDRAHFPSAGYLAYLLTADYYFWEACALTALTIYLCNSVNGSAGSDAINGGQGTDRLLYNQNRSRAWGYRSIMQAAALFPSSQATLFSDFSAWAKSLGSQLTNLYVTNGTGATWTGYETQYTDYTSNTQPPAHISLNGVAPNGQNVLEVAPWQAHFTTAGWGIGVDIDPCDDAGVAGIVSFSNYLQKAPVWISGGSGANEYNFGYAGNYTVCFRSTANIPYGSGNVPMSQLSVTDGGMVYTDSFSTSTTTATNPGTNTLTGTSGSAPSYADSYFGNLLPALAIAVDHGQTGASTAWNRFVGASNFSAMDVTANYADDPTWGIVPRSYLQPALLYTAVDSGGSVATPGPSIVVDSNPLISGSIIVSKYSGLGIPASAIPTGFASPALLLNDVLQTDPAGTEYRLLFQSLPSSGTLTINEDSSFSFVGAADGTYTGNETIYKNGVVDSTEQYSFTVGTAATVPTAPTNVTAVGGTNSATVSFTAPSSNGGSTITSYTVTASTGQTANGPSSPVTIAVAANVPVTFTVHANNAVGASPESAASNSVTPTATATVPGSPTNVVAVAGDGTVSVSFVAPLNNGGQPISSYLITASTGQTQSGTTSPIAIAMPNGVTVTFTAQAINIVGSSLPSAPSNSVTPAAKPTVSSVTVSPSNVSVLGQGTQQFIATVAGSAGISQSVIWSTNLGAIDVNGNYTAPPSIQNQQQVAIVTATSTVDSSKSGTANVTVAATFPVRLRNYNAVVRNNTGVAVKGATVTVFDQNTGNKVTLWQDPAMTVQKYNPIVVGDDGYFEFFVQSGQCGYTVQGFGIQPYTRNNIFDVATVIDLGPLQSSVAQLETSKVSYTDLNAMAAQKANVSDVQNLQQEFTALQNSVSSLLLVNAYSTGGDGSAANPWVGWDSAITWKPNTEYQFASGYYAYSTSPNFAQNNLKLSGKKGTVFLHTGTGYALTADAGPNTESVRNVSITNIIIQSNAGAQGGLFARGLYISTIEVEFFNVPNVGLTEYSCVGNRYRLIRSTSGVTQTINLSSILQSNRRVGSLQSSDNTYDIFAEGCTDFAVVLNDCSDSMFKGVVQLSANGVSVSSTSLNNNFNGVFATSNAGADIVCSGAYNSFNFMHCGGICDFAGSRNLIIGGVFDTINNTGDHNVFSNVSYATSGGSFSNSGASMTQRGLYNITTGLFSDDLYPTIQNLSASGKTTLGGDTLNVGNGQIFKNKQGLVGINTMTFINDSPLQITNPNNTTTAEGIRMNLGTNAYATTAKLFNGNTGGGDVFIVYGNGNVVNQNNSYGAISDATVKENIVDATPKLNQLMQVRVVNYNLIGRDEKLLGVVSQELAQVFPGMISHTSGTLPNGEVVEGLMGGKYSVFVPILIKAVQELTSIVQNLESKVNK